MQISPGVIIAVTICIHIVVFTCPKKGGCEEACERQAWLQQMQIFEGRVRGVQGEACKMMLLLLVTMIKIAMRFKTVVRNFYLKLKLIKRVAVCLHQKDNKYANIEEHQAFLWVI